MSLSVAPSFLALLLAPSLFSLFLFLFSFTWKKTMNRPDESSEQFFLVNYRWKRSRKNVTSRFLSSMWKTTRKKRIQERSIFQATLTSLYIHRDMNVERYSFSWACFVAFISYGSYVLSIFVAFQENGTRRPERYVTRQFPSKIMVDLLVSLSGILSTYVLFLSCNTFWVYLWLLNIHHIFYMWRSIY